MTVTDDPKVDDPKLDDPKLDDRSAFYKNTKVAGFDDVPCEEKERLFGLV